MTKTTTNSIEMSNKVLDPLQDVAKYVCRDARQQKAIIVDLDGTLCLHAGRSPYDTAMCFQDVVNYPILEIILSVKDWAHVIYCSGRDEKFRDMSINWLATHGAPVGDLFMRPLSDTRNDAIVKLEIFNREIRDIYNVRFVLDDRDRVVKMWRSLGLTCLQVAYGDF